MNTWVRSEHHLLSSPKAGQKQRSSCWADFIYCWDQLETTKWCRHPYHTGWWLNQPIWKICSSNWIISPGRVENKQYLKPPPSILVSEEFVFSHDVLNFHESEKNHLCANDHHTRDTKIRWFYTSLLSYRIISYSLLLWELFVFFVPKKAALMSRDGS